MNAPSKYDWHRTPERFEECPICGLKRKTSGEHRAVAPDEQMEAQWMRRVKSDNGWKFLPIKDKSPQKGKTGRKPPVEQWHFYGPMKKTTERIREATRLAIKGKNFKEIAKELGTCAASIYELRSRYPERWKAEAEKNMESLVAEVRATAGTDAIMEDPDAYLNKANAALSWLELRGESLFPDREKLTLSRFFEEIYLPRFLFEATHLSKARYRSNVKRWVLITSDPPIENITDEMLARYRECRLKMRGQKPYLLLSPNTLRSEMRIIQTLLDRCGPRGPRNREAIGLIKEVPWARPPREELKIPRTVKLEYFSKLYEVAVCMDGPINPGINIADWWRTLLAVAYNTGLRRGTLFSMRLSDIDWKGQRLILPSKLMKSNRPLICRLNKTALKHLQAIRTPDRELVFPWPLHPNTFWTHFHNLQKLADIPKTEYFGLAAIRKTLATQLWELNPSAAQYALGHTGMDVTRQHYVDGGPIVARALDALPQPAAFCR